LLWTRRTLLAGKGRTQVSKLIEAFNDCNSNRDIVGMVHGKCDCTHNTRGNNCEYCLDDYNDVPWRPATGKKKNECKSKCEIYIKITNDTVLSCIECNCHDHADTCFFNQYVYAATGNVSGGFCQNCTHNTEGRMCELCKIGFYRDESKPLEDPSVCLRE